MNSDFVNNEQIKEIVKRIPKGKLYSDIEDEEGNQYVDLVQEGGGVLGIALVGYTYILEKAGIRFFSLAGASAGAINTTLMAGLGEIQEKKAEIILEIISKKNLFEFVDGSSIVKKVINKSVKHEKGLGWTLFFNGVNIYKRLKKRLGLNPGQNFEIWLSGELEKRGIFSLADLEKKRAILPKGLKNSKTGEKITDLIPRIAIITSDISTNTKVEFPRMAGLYWKNPQAISPAKFARASMSIPFFFEPFEVDDIPHSGKVDRPDWTDLAGYKGKVPPVVRFVDGGLLSNFPINVFHRYDTKVPLKPTFGVRLSTYRSDYSSTSDIPKMSFAMIATMRQVYDYDFLLKHPDYKQLICRIDADKDYNWLNFGMDKKTQVELFNLGAQRAVEFLESFDWTKYKINRQN